MTAEAALSQINLMFIFLLFPGWQQPQKKRKDEERDNQPDGSHQITLSSYETNLETGVSVETLRKQLSAYHYVPSHKEDAYQNKRGNDEVEPFPDDIPGFIELQCTQSEYRDNGTEKPLEYK